MVGVNCPSPDWDRVNISEKLGVTVVILVAPMVTKVRTILVSYFMCTYAMRLNINVSIFFTKNEKKYFEENKCERFGEYSFFLHQKTHYVETHM